jgi:hypothetical protein
VPSGRGGGHRLSIRSAIGLLRQGKGWRGEGESNANEGVSTSVGVLGGSSRRPHGTIHPIPCSNPYSCPDVPPQLVPLRKL